MGYGTVQHTRKEPGLPILLRNTFLAIFEGHAQLRGDAGHPPVIRNLVPGIPSCLREFIFLQRDPVIAVELGKKADALNCPVAEILCSTDKDGNDIWSVDQFHVARADFMITKKCPVSEE